MATPADVENLRPVLLRVMQSHQLKPQDVKQQRSNIAVSDKGQFHCEYCPYTWRSNYSWLTFDLRELKIAYRWRMKCRYCLLPWIPTFTVPQIEAMFDRVVRYYKGETDPPDINIGYGGRKLHRQPHYPELCEKCNWGSDICWTRWFYV